MPSAAARLTPADRWHLRLAVRSLRRGGILAYPTEAVFGLGCDPLDAAAVLTLLDLKQRPLHKGLILIAADLEQLAPFLGPLAPARRRRVLASWPGPHTWLWPAAAHLPPWLCGAHDSLAVRVTAHPLARALCQAFGGPLVSTSANPSGQRPARTVLQVRRHFADTLDYILPGRCGDLAAPTPIRDARSGNLVRPG